MNHKDLWFLGLFAFAYFYLDAPPAAATPPVAREDDEALMPARPVALLAPPRPVVIPRDACPRNLTHRVSVRRDGAMWCHSCDQAFFPQGAIWGTLMGVPA